MVGARTLVLLLLACSLAACTNAANPSGASTSASVAAGDGLLIVQVVSSELVPLSGAVVTIAGLAQGPTDPAGEANLAVPPGSYRIDVVATGYRNATHKVEVLPGAPTRDRFLMEKLSGREPYHDVRIFDGLSVCDFNAFIIAFSYWEVTMTQDVPYCQTARTKFALNASESWQYAVMEQDWRTSDSMHMVVDDDLTCLGATNAPLRAEFAPSDKVLAAKYATDKKWTPGPGPIKMQIQATSAGNFREEANHTAPGVTPFGIGVSLGNRFQTYATLFHFARPEVPRAYTALPDR
jgi:hypothetical protein